MTKEERRAKIKWLTEYKLCGEQIKRLQSEIEQWRDRATRLTTKPTYFKYLGKEDQEKLTQEQRRRNAMAPVIIRGGKGLSTADIVAEIDALEHEIQLSIIKLAGRRRDVEEAIQGLQDYREQLVLYYKYVDGLFLEEICVKMGYSYRQIKRIHERALINLNMSPNVP